MDRTLVLCKPDAVERGLVGEIVGRLERKGLSSSRRAAHARRRPRPRRHYAEHDGKPFFGDLVAFITRSPLVAMVVEGPDDTWKVVRTLMGATNPRRPRRARSVATSRSSSPRTWCTAATVPSRRPARSRSSSRPLGDGSRQLAAESRHRAAPVGGHPAVGHRRSLLA